MDDCSIMSYQYKFLIKEFYNFKQTNISMKKM